METLKNLNKFWRTSALLPLTTTTTTSAYSDAALSDVEVEEEEEEEEESFFELELVMLNNKTTLTTTASKGDKEENESLRSSSNSTTANGSRRIVPLEPGQKLNQHPQYSPVSILKSAPKFKVSLFRKHKDNNNNSDLNPKPKPKVDNEGYTFNKPPASTILTLIRENTTSSPVSEPQKQSISRTEHDDSSKRFSKEVMHKYLKLKLIKPFHLKVAKRCSSVTSSSNKSRLFNSRDDYCSASPAPSLKSRSSSGGFRVVCKQLGKSRSASSMGSCSSTSSVVCSRRDESLVVAEHDDGGIQSAILHCKKSFNSSRDDSSMHSRSSSDEQPIVI